MSCSPRILNRLRHLTTRIPSPLPVQRLRIFTLHQMRIDQTPIVPARRTLLMQKDGRFMRSRLHRIMVSHLLPAERCILTHATPPIPLPSMRPEPRLRHPLLHRCHIHWQLIRIERRHSPLLLRHLQRRIVRLPELLPLSRTHSLLRPTTPKQRLTRRLSSCPYRLHIRLGRLYSLIENLLLLRIEHPLHFVNRNMMHCLTFPAHMTRIATSPLPQIIPRPTIRTRHIPQMSPQLNPQPRLLIRLLQRSTLLIHPLIHPPLRQRVLIPKRICRTYNPSALATRLHNHNTSPRRKSLSRNKGWLLDRRSPLLLPSGGIFRRIPGSKSSRLRPSRSKSSDLTWLSPVLRCINTRVLNQNLLPSLIHLRMRHRPLHSRMRRSRSNFRLHSTQLKRLRIMPACIAPSPILNHVRQTLRVSFKRTLRIPRPMIILQILNCLRRPSRIRRKVQGGSLSRPRTRRGCNTKPQSLTCRRRNRLRSLLRGLRFGRRFRLRFRLRSLGRRLRLHLMLRQHHLRRPKSRSPRLLIPSKSLGPLRSLLQHLANSRSRRRLERRLQSQLPLQILLRPSRPVSSPNRLERRLRSSLRFVHLLCFFKCLPNISQRSPFPTNMSWIGHIRINILTLQKGSSLGRPSTPTRRSRRSL